MKIIINFIHNKGFGFIADGEELFNNIPVQGKNFRAITYDEKKYISIWI